MVNEVEFLYDGKIRVTRLRGGGYQIMHSKTDNGICLGIYFAKTEEDKERFVREISSHLGLSLEEIFKAHSSE